jgi:hypothetical protein
MDHEYVERHDVVERYLRHRLEDDEAHAFEDHFVDCADCLNLLETDDRLREDLRRYPLATPSARWFGPPFIRVVAAAAVVVLAVASSVAYFNTRRTLMALQDRTVVLERQYDAARVQVDQLERARSPAPSATPLDTNVARVEVFELEATRGADVAPAPTLVRIAPSTTMVVFALEAGSTGGYSSFNISVVDRNGTIVFRRSDLHAASETAVAIAVPRTSLTEGRHSIELEAVANGRPPFPLARYSIDVSSGR